MREILFRAKRVDNGEWVEGVPIKTHIGLFMCFDENPHYCHQYGYMEIDKIIKVDENTLCQYTGLKDRNGNKIWEHDIVKGTFWGFMMPVENYTFEISWQDAVAGWCRNVMDDDNEVIGNIFDNPELLKE